ncbi:formyl-coenzyme A transferase [Peptococcaceae bacterium CEB3]|nr:formyl-coenzyme A transferase [Peptococcaceae bacterium CEB3]
MPSPLDGVKILDISRVLTGPFCTMLLGDLGAEVIKIEMPEKGDETREWGPPFVAGESSYYLSINRNKRSLTLDLKSEKGREIFFKLASEADVIVENFLPGTVTRLGIDYEAVRRVKPEIIYCSISGFGQDGPFKSVPAYDLMMQGIGGLMSITGEKNGEPVRIGVALIDIGAGMYAALGIMSALMVKKQTGQGQYVDVSLLDTETSWLTYMATNYFATGKDPVRLGSAHPTIVPYQAYPAKDQPFVLAVGNDAIWHRFCAALGLSLDEDPKFVTNHDRVQNRENLNEILYKLFKQKNAQEWIDLLQAARVPCGLVNAVSQVVNHPQTKHRRMVVEMGHPKAGTIKVLGNPIKLSRTPAQYRLAPPLLGQQTEEILTELGYSSQEISEFRESGVI